MKYRIFVDGQAGTTGLEIHERLEKRTDLEVMEIDPEKRKDPVEKRRIINEADVVFLCLPDAAARESAALVTNGRTRILDASTAHRTDPSWTYGIPEIDRDQRKRIASSKRVSVPGCHASAFVLGFTPLIRKGILDADYPVTIHSVTGYSGGGKKLIEAFENSPLPVQVLNSPRHYALGLLHKHLPEMQKAAGLANPPLFMPIIGNFYRGLVVGIPLHTRLLARKTTAEGIHSELAEYYEGEKFVKVMPWNSEALIPDGFFDPTGCNGTNRAEIFVFGNENHVLVLTRLDNLGKGASGAAVQDMNIMLGIDEATGLQA